MAEVRWTEGLVRFRVSFRHSTRVVTLLFSECCQLVLFWPYGRTYKTVEFRMESPTPGIETAISVLQHIPFKLFRHAPAFSVAEHARVTTSFEPNLTKCLFVRAQKQLVIVLARYTADTHFKTISALLRCTNVRLAGLKTLQSVLQVKVHDLSPLALVNDTKKQVAFVLCDKSLEGGTVGISALTNTATLSLEFRELVSLIAGKFRVPVKLLDFPLESHVLCSPKTATPPSGSDVVEGPREQKLFSTTGGSYEAKPSTHSQPQQSTTFKRGGNPRLKGPSSTVATNEQAHAHHYLKLYRQLLEDSARCPRCWMMKAHCFCTQIVDVSKELAPKYQIILFIHYRELVKARGSNTGKLLLAACGGTAIVCGVPEDETKLIEIIKRSERTSRALLLFPSPDALSVPQFVRGMGLRTAAASASLDSSAVSAVAIVTAGSDVRTPSPFKVLHVVAAKDSPGFDGIERKITCSETSLAVDVATRTDSAVDADRIVALPPASTSKAHLETDDDQRLTLIVLDGTWGNAKMLNRRLTQLMDAAGAAAPRVSLTGSSRAEFGGGCRKKKMAGERVSTFGAFIHLLSELGESAELLASLRQTLSDAMLAYVHQAHKSLHV